MINKHNDKGSARIMSMPEASKSKDKKRNSIRKKKDRLKDLDYLMAEQFKALKLRIIHSQNGNSPRTILISSAFPNEGKSTVASNLAVSLAQGLQERALLVDCDFKKPDIHTVFGLTPEKGLADYLSGEVPLNQVFLKTKMPKLTLLPVGNRPANPVELLASDKMRLLIQELKERYEDRYIIFDSSPIQITSEPMTLVSQMDGIVLVVKAGETNREIVMKIIQKLEKERFLGIVLNGLKKSHSSHYYSYHNYYHSYYR